MRTRSDGSDTYYTSSGTSPPRLVLDGFVIPDDLSGLSLDSKHPGDYTPGERPVLAHETHVETPLREWLVCPDPKTHLDPHTGELKPFFVLTRVKDEYEPARCGLNTCPICVWINSWGYARAIQRAGIDFVLGLSQVGSPGETWSEIGPRMSSFFFQLRLVYPTLKHGFGVEPNPAETGAHAHCYLHLDDESISPEVIAECASRVGIGPEFKLDRPEPNSKQSFFGYAMKTLADPATQAAYRAVNGTRIFHTSKTGFFRDGKGGPTLTLRQAKSRKPTGPVTRFTTQPTPLVAAPMATTTVQTTTNHPATDQSNVRMTMPQASPEVQESIDRVLSRINRPPSPQGDTDVMPTSPPVRVPQPLRDLTDPVDAPKPPVAHTESPTEPLRDFSDEPAPAKVPRAKWVRQRIPAKHEMTAEESYALLRKVNDGMGLETSSFEEFMKLRAAR